MRKTKVTEIVYKPFAEKLINIMKLQLEKPKSQLKFDYKKRRTTKPKTIVT